MSLTRTPEIAPASVETCCPSATPTSWPAVRVLASLDSDSALYSCHFFERDVVVTVRTLDLLTEGVSREFNVFLAEKTGHFQVPRFPQGDAGLAVRAGGLFSQVIDCKSDMPTTRGADHFQAVSPAQPNPNRASAASQQQIGEDDV